MEGFMQIKVKKLCDRAILPEYGTEGAAGGDLRSAEEKAITIKPKETALIGTGLAVAIPEGFVGLVYARSGLASKRGLAPANKVGVIDSDYRGEIKVALYNQSDCVQTVEPSERIAQLVVAPYIKAEYCETDELEKTVRGEGGFGSTGKK